MQKKWLIALPILLIVLVLCVAMVAIAVFYLADVGLPSIKLFDPHIKAEEIVNEEFSVGIPATLEISNQFGWIKITAADVDQIQVEAKKIAYGYNQSDAEQELKKIKLEMTQAGDRVVIKGPQEKIVGNIADLKPKSVEFTIKVPARTIVIADTSFGDIFLSGTEADADLTSSFGQIEVQDLTGSLVTNNTNGATTLTNLNSGDGKVTVNSSFGDVTASKLEGGTLYIKSENGRILLEDGNASSTVTLKSSFGDIDFIRGNAESVDIDSSNGSVVIRNVNVTNEIDINTSFGGVDINDVAAKEYKVQTANGEAKLDGVAGYVKAETEFGQITISRAENMVLDLKSANGGIDFEGSLADGPHNLKTSFGSITLKLPEETNLDVDLTTSFGSIDVGFDLSTTDHNSYNQVTGKIGAGGDLLQAETNNGSITIEVLQ